MARARIIIKRRKAVRNIKKITKVMQMIATARYQKAFKRAIGTRPYVQKIGELVASATQTARALGMKIEHPLMKDPAADKPLAVLVLTSNRGLCGGYNGSILRLAGANIRETEAAGKTIQLSVSGKKGMAYFRFQKREMAQTYATLGDNPKYAEIETLANQFMQDFTDRKISGLRIVFMRFLSAGVQRAAVLDVLPLGSIGGKADEHAVPTAFEFSPGPDKLLKELIPSTVKITLFQAFIEAAVSEQIARMVAMKAATDAAEKMGKKLTQEYNRARQSQITSELAELMGGVEAMK
jgi:F-type H+-transporting ATPase subunit gamma